MWLPILLLLCVAFFVLATTKLRLHPFPAPGLALWRISGLAL